MRSDTATSPPPEHLVSISRAAELFQRDRRTISKALTGTEPEAIVRGAHLHPIATVARALFSEQKSTTPREELQHRKLVVEVQTAELDYEERLVGVADARGLPAVTAELSRQALERFLRVPAAVAERCAAEDDSHRIRTLLDGEFREALEELAASGEGGHQLGEQHGSP